MGQLNVGDYSYDLFNPLDEIHVLKFFDDFYDES